MRPADSLRFVTVRTPDTPLDFETTMMARALALSMFVAAFSVVLAAADLSGYWMLELKPDFGGNDDTISCTFTQDGTALKANCAGAEMTGSVDGQTVTLSMTTGEKRELTATFTGTLNQPGTAITGMWRISGGGAVGDFTATKR